MSNKKFSFILLLLIITTPAFSQHDGWQNYTDSRNVTGVVSDGNNWWIATTGGLIKINIADGTKTVFNHANSPLPSNNLTCIDINTYDGLSIWIGTVEGIAVYNRQQAWELYNTDNTPLPSNQITCLDYHESNIVLIGTNVGAVLLSGSNWDVYDDVNFYINTVYVESINSLYAAAGGNVFRSDGQIWINLSTPAGTRNITAMKKDGSINLWVSTWGEGILSWDGYNWTEYNTYNSPFQDNNFSSLDIDESNNVWFGSGYYGVWVRMADGTWWIYQSPAYDTPSDLISRVLVINKNYVAAGCYDGFFTIDNSQKETLFNEYDITNSPLEGNAISAVYINRNNANDKYISTVGKIYEFSGNNDYISSETPFSYNYPISDIITDQFGTVWVSTASGGGISVKKIDGWTEYNYFNSGISDANINCLLWEPLSEVHGMLWLGGEQAGLRSFDDSVWTAFPENPYGIQTTNISDMLLDDNGNIWITGWHLEKFNGTSTVGYFNELNQLITTCIAKEGNTLWIGATPYLSKTGGITKFDGTDFTNYYTGNSDLPGNTITKIVIDNSGKKYVGTTEGLAIFDNPSNMAIYNRENSGLSENHITDLDIDANGNVWIGTESGGLAILGNVSITEIPQHDVITPEGFQLLQNYPNPFNPATTIQYSIPGVETGHAPSLQHVTLKIYDVLGREVTTLVNEIQNPGTYQFEFNANGLASGIYFYELRVGGFCTVKKLMLLK
ncbi:MAG: two-component regulator propeller domain-containing protein [bacterium]